MRSAPMDPDVKALDQRAAALARPRAQPDEGRDVVDALEFRLLGAPFAVALERVEAVFRVGQIHQVPLVSRHLVGIVRRHGRSITLVSLRHFFDPDAEGLMDADYALSVAVHGQRFAFQVEDVEGVRRLERAELRAAPESLDSGLRPYVEGVTEGGLILIDLPRLAAAEGFSMGRARGGVP